MTATSPRFGAGQQALEAAIVADDRSAVAQALAAGGRIDARDAQKVTPLMLAVDRLKLQAAAELLARGADPNARAADGHSAVTLAVASYRRAPELVFDLLKAGGDPNARTPGNDPIIKRFANDHDCALMRRMRQAGADVNALTRAGSPLILDAATATDWDTVWCLLELGAKFDYPAGPPEFNLSQLLNSRVPAPDSPIYPYKVKVRDFLRAKGLLAPALAGDAAQRP